METPVLNKITYPSIEQSYQLLTEFQERAPSHQRALCCLLGAYAGDNLGNYNEFWNRIKESQLDEAMRMEGGGTHSLIPGQSTDDTELATSLGFGLIANQPGVIDLNLIANSYGIWIQSGPFDIGCTTRNALKPLFSIHVDENMTFEDSQASRISTKPITSAFLHNQGSVSNGGVMRISPLIVLLSRTDDPATIKRVVSEEQSLTHSNPIAKELAYVFVRICGNLIRKGSAREAYDDLLAYMKEETDVSEVKTYIKDFVIDTQKINATLSQGWLRHAFILSMQALKDLAEAEIAFDSRKEVPKGKLDLKLGKGEIYQRYLKDTLRYCGDSDTNGAIVGSLIGCYLQLNEFPEDYLNKLITADVQDRKNPLLRHYRPIRFNPRNSLMICDKLLTLAELTEKQHNIWKVVPEKQPLIPVKQEKDQSQQINAGIMPKY